MNTPFIDTFESRQENDPRIYRLAIKGLDPTHAVEGEIYEYGAIPQVAESDGEFVEPLLEIAKPIGRVKSAQLATAIHTDDLDNIFHRSLSPGGSSGGSAVAVASGEVDIATATDAGGSIRIPAALAGLFALKPTPGILPKEKNDWGGLSVSGVIASDVDLTAKALDTVQASTSDNDYYSFARYLRDEVPPQKIVMVNGYFDEESNSVNGEALESSKGLLIDLGHEVLDKRSVGFGLEGVSGVSKANISEAFVIIMAVNVARTIQEAEEATDKKATRDLLTNSNWALREMGIDYESEYDDAISQMADFRQQFWDVLGQDVLLLPTLKNPTPKKSDMTPSSLVVAAAVGVSALSRISDKVDLNRHLKTAKTASSSTPLMTAVANLAGVPAATNPVGSTEYKGVKVPVGVQTVGRPRTDNILIGMGKQLEELKTI